MRARNDGKARAMDATFWHRKWESNEISFHGEKPNPLLLRHFPALRLAKGARVFVPLCGKSLDIHWLLANGCRVAGAELSRLAVEQLFDELGVVPRITPAGPLERFEADGLSIFVGNIFDLDRASLGAVDAVYDRVALVALPEDMRVRYAAHLVAVTASAPQLVVAYEYDPSCTAGPPFPVTEAEIRRHYEPGHRLTRLERHEVEGGLRGCPAQESVWLVEPRAAAPQIA